MSKCVLKASIIIFFFFFYLWSCFSCSVISTYLPDKFKQFLPVPIAGHRIPALQVERRNMYVQYSKYKIPVHKYTCTCISCRLIVYVGVVCACLLDEMEEMVKMLRSESWGSMSQYDVNVFNLSRILVNLHVVGQADKLSNETHTFNFVFVI